MKKMKKNNYLERKEEARQEAIEYQRTFSDHDYSYMELYLIESRFRELGKSYGLLKEFKENGIC